ncbi:MAG: DNA polymerase III subunit gamma/tau [Nitrosopumilus sp.]|nr:DNA polymerase III subunit gamma/tau [Nitrosopumilus sp.]
MDNFIVSARKYRPATFDTVVGQYPITSTLKNAIKNNHLAQAFLFCGPRGVGKTTCARILAKTINCQNITANTEACDVCESCVSFNNAQSLNIYELDAASNNSVDDIRNLVEQVRFAPHMGKYKIYIIDEVHMLSANAFNAFLKTLEEPPPYAIFILATTEKHKIIPTILSRCQIFDFSRIKVDDIAKHLSSIAVKEKIEAEYEAMHVIAQKADGALRDALSMFDQIVSFAGNNVTYKHAIDNLNILDYDYYFRVMDQVMEGNIPAVMLTFDEILANGFDGHNFINGFSKHIRDLMVCKDASTLTLLEVSETVKSKYRSQSEKAPATYLLNILEILNTCDVQYKSARNQRLHVELALLKLCALNFKQENKNSVSQPQFTTPEPVKTQPAVVAPPQAAPPVSKTQTAPVAASTPVAKTPEPEKPAPEPTPKTTPATSRISTVSINSLKTEKKETKQEEAKEIEISGRQEFTQEQFAAAWTDFANKNKASGEMSLCSILSKRTPVIDENNIINLQVDNEVSEDKINLVKSDLLTYLREKLDNGSLQLNMTVVKDNSDNSNKLYTAIDKFKRMAEKNPAINDLRKQFDLEIGI